MALPSWAGHRRSLADARNDGRRMEVTWHEDARVVVISLWQDDKCRATFQMPLEDAPALIALLSSALGDALSTPLSTPLRARAPDRTSAKLELPSGTELLTLIRGLVRRHRADVVPLSSAKRRPEIRR